MGHSRRFRPSGLAKPIRGFPHWTQETTNWCVPEAGRGVLSCVTYTSIYPDAEEGNKSSLSSVECSQLCWVASSLSVSRPVHLIHFYSAFNFAFGRKVCGLVQRLVRIIQRPPEENKRECGRMDTWGRKMGINRGLERRKTRELVFFISFRR